MATKTSNRSRVGESSETWMTQCREATAATVDEHPFSTTIGVFAIGLSLGVAVGAALARSSAHPHREIAESLGRRMLDAVQEYVPASVSKYLHA